MKQDAVKSYMGLFSGNSPTEESCIEYELRTRTACIFTDQFPPEATTPSQANCAANGL